MSRGSRWIMSLGMWACWGHCVEEARASYELSEIDSDTDTEVYTNGDPHLNVK